MWKDVVSLFVTGVGDSVLFHANIKHDLKSSSNFQFNNFVDMKQFSVLICLRYVAALMLHGLISELRSSDGY